MTGASNLVRKGRTLTAYCRLWVTSREVQLEIDDDSAYSGRSTDLSRSTLSDLLVSGKSNMPPFNFKDESGILYMWRADLARRGT